MIDRNAVDQQPQNPLSIQDLEYRLDIRLGRNVRSNDHHDAVAEFAHGLRVRQAERGRRVDEERSDSSLLTVYGFADRGSGRLHHRFRQRRMRVHNIMQ